jgi:hypothetical protein
MKFALSFIVPLLLSIPCAVSAVRGAAIAENEASSHKETKWRRLSPEDIDEDEPSPRARMLARGNNMQSFEACFKGMKKGTETPGLGKNEFKDNTDGLLFYCFDDGMGMTGMATREEDKITRAAILEAQFTLENGVSCYFIIEGAFGKAPYAMAKCTGAMGDRGKENLRYSMSHMKQRVDDMCGKKDKQCPTNFMYGMMQFMDLETTGWQNKALPYWEGTLTIRSDNGDRNPESNPEGLEHEHGGEDDEEDDERMLTHTCRDPWLGEIASAVVDAEETNCPVRVSTAPRDSGATCMCPYYSNQKRWSYYDAIDPATEQSTNLAWLKHYGGNTAHCSGRCGVRCNPYDEEAFEDW